MGLVKGTRIGVYDLDGCVVDSSTRLKKYVDTDALRSGDYTKYCHSFQQYGMATEDDVPISKGIMLVSQLAAMYQVDALVALTSRGSCGRKPTELWLKQNLPWSTGGDLLVMHREMHFGFVDRVRDFDSNLNVSTTNSRLLKSPWGYETSLHAEREYVERDGFWFCDVDGERELFSPSLYKVNAMNHLLSMYDVAFAVDDHPQIIESFDGMPFDSFRVVWSGVDCLTPAGDARVAEDGILVK